MNARRLVDTNLIIRYLVQDHAEHSGVATRLVEACVSGELIVVLLPSVLAECVFVLETVYELPRAAISKVLSHLISSEGIEIADVAVHLDALSSYGARKLDFIDCVIAAYAAERGVEVASFDSDFRKFPDVRVILA